LRTTFPLLDNWTYACRTTTLMLKKHPGIYRITYFTEISSVSMRKKWKFVPCKKVQKGSEWGRKQIICKNTNPVGQHRWGLRDQTLWRIGRECWASAPRSSSLPSNMASVPHTPAHSVLQQGEQPSHANVPTCPMIQLQHYDIHKINFILTKILITTSCSSSVLVLCQ